MSGSSPEPETVTAMLRVPRAERAYVHWILEAHEGLATVTEPPEADGELVVTVLSDQRSDLERVLAALATEVPLVVRFPPVS